MLSPALRNSQSRLGVLFIFFLAKFCGARPKKKEDERRGNTCILAQFVTRFYNWEFWEVESQYLDGEVYNYLSLRCSYLANSNQKFEMTGLGEMSIKSIKWYLSCVWVARNSIIEIDKFIDIWLIFRFWYF